MGVSLSNGRRYTGRNRPHHPFLQRFVLLLCNSRLLLLSQNPIHQTRM